VDNRETLQEKLERIETLVDTLVEERNSLKIEMGRIEKQQRRATPAEGSRPAGEDLIKALDDLRSRLAESEAANQKLSRERDQVRERLSQIKSRLDLVEARLLEQRSAAGNSRG